jgi:hypothetical protein
LNQLHEILRREMQAADKKKDRLQKLEQLLEPGNGSLHPASPLRFPAEDGGASLADMAQRDLDAALQLLADRAQYITGANGAAIALRRAGKSDMQCRASSGENVPELGALLSTEFGLSGESVRTRRALRCDDAERDPRVNREGCRQLGIASVVVMPVVNDDEVLGVFELFSGKVNAFGERDLSALQRLSEMVETAVKLAHAAANISTLAATSSESAEEILDVEMESSQLLATSSPSTAAQAAEIRTLESRTEEKWLDQKKIEERRLIADLQALAPTVSPSTVQDRSDGSIDKNPSTPAATVVATPGPVAQTISASALPKKPLFWSVAMNPVTGAEKPAAPDQSHVPPMLRNLRTCEACGFPVSPGRGLCVECEEKRWRGQLKRPSPTLPQEVAAKAAASDSLNRSTTKELKDPKDASSATTAVAEAPVAGPVARLMAAAAAQSTAAPPPAVTPTVLPPPAVREAAPVTIELLAKPTPSTDATLGDAASSIAPEEPSPDFVLSAGLEPQQSWLAANLYVIVILLLVAGAVAATILLH